MVVIPQIKFDTFEMLEQLFNICNEIPAAFQTAIGGSLSNMCKSSNEFSAQLKQDLLEKLNSSDFIKLVCSNVQLAFFMIKVLIKHASEWKQSLEPAAIVIGDLLVSQPKIPYHLILGIFVTILNIIEDKKALTKGLCELLFE